MNTFNEKLKFVTKAIIDNIVPHYNEDLVNEVKKGNLEGVQKIIENGEPNELNTVDSVDTKKSILMYGVQANNMEIVKYLLEKGANINYRDNKNNTAVHYSIYTENLDMINLLLSYNPTFKNKTKADVFQYFMDYYTINKNEKMIKFLFSKGASIYPDQKIDKLSYAIEKDNLAAVRSLLYFGTPLKAEHIHLTIKRKSNEILKFFIENNFNIINDFNLKENYKLFDYFMENKLEKEDTIRLFFSFLYDEDNKSEYKYISNILDRIHFNNINIERELSHLELIVQYKKQLKEVDYFKILSYFDVLFQTGLNNTNEIYNLQKNLFNYLINNTNFLCYYKKRDFLEWCYIRFYEMYPFIEILLQKYKNLDPNILIHNKIPTLQYLFFEQKIYKFDLEVIKSCLMKLIEKGLKTYHFNQLIIQKKNEYHDIDLLWNLLFNSFIFLNTHDYYFHQFKLKRFDINFIFL